MALKKYKDGEVIYEADKEGGKLAPVLADMTLGKAKGLYGEYTGGKQFVQDLQTGSGDIDENLAKGHRMAKYTAGKLAQGSTLVKGLNLEEKAAKMSAEKVADLGKLADPAKKLMKGTAKAAEAAGKASHKALGALDAVPVADALTAVSSAKSLTDGSMAWATEDEKAATAMAGTGAVVGGVATAAGAAGTTAAAGAAAGAAAAGGAGFMGTVGAGLAALGPIGWATLALGAGAAALGVFGNKSFRKRGKW